MAEENVELREEKARNSTSSEELKKLSEDDESYVRSLVSENSNTPSSVLEKLADDDDYSVRYKDIFIIGAGHTSWNCLSVSQFFLYNPAFHSLSIERP